MFNEFKQVIAIGDVHGDLDALLRILTGLDLVDSEGRWCGGSTTVLFVGDLNDRGPESVNVTHFVMDLQRDAAGQGGQVIALLGNHEVLAADGDYRYVRAVEVLECEHWWYEDVNGLHAVFRGNSPYAQWLRSRPAIHQIDGTLFVHAALGSWALTYPPAALNQLMSAWVAHFQGVADSPDESTYSLTQDEEGSPVWSKRLLVGGPSIDDGFAELLAQVLNRYGAERLVVGHCPTKTLDYRIGYPHPEFGTRVAAIDTGISRHYGGRLSALHIHRDVLTPKYFDRGEGELDVTGRVRERCTHQRSAMGSA